jgi:protein-disulfide isomerase
MINGEHSQTIVGSNDDARALELTGTPAFFVIGPDGKVTRLFGAQPYDVFERVFDEELKKQS